MENSYDALPYTCYPRAETHPDHLACIATIFGLRPPPAKGCRLLELGCADGTNLIAIALALPDAKIRGVDLSQRQIDSGRERVEALGLSNVQLECGDILDIDQDFGEFDYIIVHGIYSWVPAHVQSRILDICNENLSTDGVAYISYNTRPGWNMRRTIRDMLMYHTGQFHDIPKRVEQLRAWLNLLEKYVADEDTPYKRYLKEESELFLSQHDDYLFHELLEENNHPEYFHQFMDKAASHGLSYVGDAQISAMFRELRSPQLFETLGDLNMIPREQYLDFLENRPFRQTLLCHRDVEADPGKGLQPETMKNFWFSSSLAPSSETPDIASDSTETFKNTQGEFREDIPIAKAAWLHLHEHWPASVAFDALYQAARTRLDKAASPADETELAGALLRAFLSGLLHIHLVPPQCTAQAGENPKANPLARLQAGQGEQAVATWRSDVTQLSPSLLGILPWLDGEHSREELTDLLKQKIDEGELKPPVEITDQTLRSVLDNLLDSLAKNALLS